MRTYYGGTIDHEGFIKRYIKYRSIYQAFYGSFWWLDQVPIVAAIGGICLRYMAYRNSRWVVRRLSKNNFRHTDISN